MNNFIDEEKIHSLIKQKENPIKSEIKRILNKALQLKGLDLEEVAALINIKGKESLSLGTFTIASEQPWFFFVFVYKFIFFIPYYLPKSRFG